MSMLVNILAAILGLTLVFGGFVGWLIKLAISRKKISSLYSHDNSRSEKVLHSLEGGDHNGNI